MAKNVIDGLNAYDGAGSFVGYFDTLLEGTSPYVFDEREFRDVLRLVDKNARDSEALDCVLILADWHHKNEGDGMEIFNSWRNLKGCAHGDLSERMRLLLSHTG